MLAATMGEDFDEACSRRIFSADSVESCPAFTACSTECFQSLAMKNELITLPPAGEFPLL
jgi:hypothetical protein